MFNRYLECLLAAGKQSADAPWGRSAGEWKLMKGADSALRKVVEEGWARKTNRRAAAPGDCTYE